MIRSLRGRGDDGNAEAAAHPEIVQRLGGLRDLCVETGSASVAVLGNSRGRAPSEQRTQRR